MAAGYSNRFVEEPSEDLRWQCHICKDILREPVLVTCCCHKFCRVCIDGWRRKGVNPTECPFCRRRYKTVPETELERILLDKQVWCSRRVQGCKWKGILRNALKHEETDCQCILTYCPYRCGEKVLKIKIGAHRKECRQQPLPCKFSKYGCDHIFPFVEQEAHYTEHCQHHLSLVETELNKTKEVLCDSKKKLQDTVEVSTQKLSQKDTSLKEKEVCYKKAEEDLRHVKEELKKAKKDSVDNDSRLRSKEKALVQRERECNATIKRLQIAENVLKKRKKYGYHQIT